MGLKAYKFFNIALFAGILVFFAVVVFVFNILPNTNNFVAQGDYYQGVSLERNISQYFYTWFDLSGQGQYNPLVTTSPYYLLQLGLQSLGVSYGLIANILMYFFLCGAFFSFYFAIKIFSWYLGLAKNRWAEIYTSLFYSMNVFTFQILTYSYGYLHHFLIYLFLPILIAIPLKIFASPEERPKHYLYFIVLLVVSLSSFNNVAFLFILISFQALLYFLLKIFRFEINIKDILYVIILELAIGLVVILPFIASQLQFSDKLQTTKSFGGDAMNIIKKTSNSLLNIFSVHMQKYRFPSVSLFGGVLLKEYLPLLFFLPYIFITTLLFRPRTNRKIVGIFFIIFLIVLILTARFVEPFKTTISVFFSIPGSLLFRSPDKIFIYLQYVLSILLFLSVHNVVKRKYKIILIVLFIFSTFMFYAGGINKYLTQGYEANLLTPKVEGYKLLVKVPDEYLNISNTINLEERSQAIISLPYSVVNSLNWSNYPKWNFVGHDVLFLLFNNRYISANSYDHPTKETTMSFYEFERNKLDPKELLKIFKKFGGQYILYHKDIEPIWLENSQHTRESLETLTALGRLSQIEDNSFFTLYKLSDEELHPLIELEGGSIRYEKISPVKYRLSLHITHDSKLIFLQSFNNQWKLFPQKISEDSSGCKKTFSYSSHDSLECIGTVKPISLTDLSLVRGAEFGASHFMYLEYANGWNLDKNEILDRLLKNEGRVNADGSVDVNLILYFVPQTYFYYGIMIVVIIFLIAICRLVRRGITS